MWNEVNLARVVTRFLPSRAKIITMEGTYKKPAIIMADLDNDGSQEIIAAYTLGKEPHLIILKHYYSGWRVEGNIRGKGYNVTYLKAAPVTNSNTRDLIVGWQIGSIWSTLSIFKWSNRRLKEVTKDKIVFSKIEVEAMPSTKGIMGTVEIALWRHFTGEGYEVDVYRWGDGDLEPALDVYPYYFPKVVWYYKMKLKEMQGIGFYWYFLGNAQFKAGMYEEALHSISKALIQENPFPSKDDLLKLKDKIQKKLKGTKKEISYGNSHIQRLSEMENIIEYEELYSDDREIKKIEQGKQLIELNESEAQNRESLNDTENKDLTNKDNINLYPAAMKVVGGTRWGYINSEGDFDIQPKFDYAMDFENGLAIVGVDNLQGVIDESGNYVIEPKYGSITGFSEGRGTIIDKEGFKVINEKGEILTPKGYGFIGQYKEGRALFAETNPQGNYVYGYLDLQGKEVIPAKFEAAGDFARGTAVVKVKDNQYQLIDINGKMINTYNYSFVGDLKDGLLAFKETDKDQYGYINGEGKVVIEPKFQWAGSFNDGRAIINMSDNFLNKYGLIDKEGNIVINPQYNEINFLGDSRIALGKAIDEEKPYMGSKYALGDESGNILTDFIFSIILPFEKGAASVTNGKNTFFIDVNGKVIGTLPIVEGEGTLFLEENLIKANIDYRTSYFDKEGNLIWSENTIIPLNEQYEVVEQKYKPNKDYLVYYPQVQGMENKEAQEQVNETLKGLSLVKQVDGNIQLEYNYVGDFSVEFFKDNLLVLELNGYEYYFGAAHGMPSKVYVHINLSDGKIYNLKDLFKESGNYIEILSDIVREQIKNMDDSYYIFPDTYKGIREDQPFYVDENNLYIYFAPYEIAAYAAGFPTFKIPFTEIMYIINTEGEFWRAFHSNVEK